MKINFEQMYHGAALTQIAEHRHFTAINVIRSGGSPHRSAFCLNKSICVYLKYARHPTKSYGEYVFTFTTRHLEDLRRLRKRYGDVFLALICVDDLEIIHERSRSKIWIFLFVVNDTLMHTNKSILVSRN